MTSFSELGLAPSLLKALAAEGYERPTPIQIQAIPQVLGGRDICGIAQTGTGKTAAFALPILQHLGANPRQAPRKGCRALILSPTRELASQIADSFRTYGRHQRLSVAVVFGGVPVPRQERLMANGVDVLVATPGRLLDLIDRRSLSLNGVEILVLDEADQMLDLGFIHSLRRIVTLLPQKRQSLFFSATMPKTISSLADQFLTDPVKVAVAPVATTAERVEQKVIFVSSSQKQPLLEHILSDPAMERVLVFTRTKHGADRVVRQLDRAGIESAAIHGNKSQGQREKALSAFRAGHCRVLIATDIAARGIDVDGVTHVINFELPNVPESYVHRIGRTARAGATGLAISFCNDEERAYLRDIERLTRLKVPVEALPSGLLASAPRVEEPARQQEPRHRANNAPRGRQGEPRRGNGGGKPAQGKRPGSGPARPVADRHEPTEARSGRPARQGQGRRPGGSHGGAGGRDLPAFVQRSSGERNPGRRAR